MTSWGLLLSQAQSLTALQNEPWLMIPGLFIMAAVLSFNFVGDALRDAVDPYRAVEKV
jgi:peptide/nickel transport system permease protein